MLRALKINKRKELRLKELESLRAKQEELKTKSAELAKALDEAETEEDISLVEAEIDQALADEAENNSAIEAAENDIADLDEELSGLEEKQDRTKDSTVKIRGLGGNHVAELRTAGELNLRAKTPYEKRDRMRSVLETKENKEFYERIADVIKNRAVTNTDLLIPEIIIDMINIDMLDVGKIYGLVTVRQVPGTTRIILNGDTPDAVWLDCCGDLSELSLDFNLQELDCYKIGGFIAICNATLEDAFINLAVHIQEQLVKAIAVGLDRAILNGTGATGKQPAGIIPALVSGNKITVTSDYATVMSNFGLLPDDASNLTAVMTRATYYKHFAPQTIATTSAGQVISQSAGNARLPDGTPVVFTNKKNIADDRMLLGDFSKYLLVQRKGLQLAKSEEVRFLQDQTVFKGTARYDGKPIKKEYWLLFTLTVPAAK